MLTVGLNRTAVAFAHDNDTFGWYFYPRLQSPPEERNNVIALARLIWSTGPTRRYDLRNRELEPGIRECEAVIVMPAFVPTLKIDITTNWERLVKPGSIKVDYVKMIDQAAEIQQALGYSGRVNDQQCYRAEDYDLLASRVEQLEKMLPLQQQLVRLPFPYVLGGTELFDSGNQHLPPELKDYYGLEWLPSAKKADSSSQSNNDKDGANTSNLSILSNVNNNAAAATASTAAAAASPNKADGASGVYFFIRGRHFHPTQTHVIAGGVKADSIDSTPVAAASKPDVKAAADASKPADPAKAATDTSNTAAATAKPAGDASPPNQAPVVADVVVISRELLRVKLSSINPTLTRCCVSVYVATPAGISNPLIIPLQGSSRCDCMGTAEANKCEACLKEKPPGGPPAPKPPAAEPRADNPGNHDSTDPSQGGPRIESDARRGGTRSDTVDGSTTASKQRPPTPIQNAPPRNNQLRAQQTHDGSRADGENTSSTPRRSINTVQRASYDEPAKPSRVPPTIVRRVQPPQ